ncbi:MAG: PQQ-binding-like beta-propeller repeat protein, partial [Candidatus Brocadiia bacterium]
EWHERKVSVSAFEMGRFAVTYRQWAAVRHWAEAHGYEFDRSGDLGSCYWSDGTTHAPDEPVTRVTIWDAMVFCNALSEARERRPCYYTDADRTQVLRRAFLERPPHPAPPDFGTQHAYVPWVFVDWSADGYRLPTLTESRYAARGGKEPGPFPWGSGMDDADEYIWHQWSRDADGEVSGRTHGAAETLEAKEPNGFGLYDIVGNVYELSWSTLPGNVKSRHRLEDLDNPKWSRFWSYGLPAYAHRVRGRGLSFGSSWHWGVPRLGNKTPPCCHQFGTGSRDEAFPDVGFRVVRCEAGTHPVDGKMPLRPKIVLDYDPGDYDPLESAAHRYSIQRNAVFPGPGVADGPHLEKMFATPGPVLSSPVVHDGVVYFGCRPDDAGKGGMFCALDAGTMELLWSVEVPGGVDSSACVHEGVVYFGGRNGRLYAVTAGREGGQTRWAVQVAGKPLDSSPAVAYGCVFVHEGAYGKTAGIRGFRVADGQMAYLSPCAPYGKAAACVTPNLALSTHLAGTVVRAAKLRDEMVAWTSSVPAFGRQDVVVVGDTVYGVLGGGKIGGFYEPGHIAAIDLATGEQHWRRKLEEHIGETAYCFSSPVVWDGRIFIGMDNGYMHVYDAATGQPLPWRIRVTDSGGEPAPIRTSPSVSAPNGVVYFGAGDGVLYALDGRTGEFRWTLKLSELPIKSSVWVAGDSIFVGTAEGLAKVTRRPAPRGAEP